MSTEKTYWQCWGSKNTEEWDRKVCSVVFETAEEAEAHACGPHENGWKWDREPARPTTIADALKEARSVGRLGVIIRRYRNGRWDDTKTYHSGVPYFPEGEK